MIISEQWLRDWINVDLDAPGIADCLTNAGLEVDGVQALSDPIDHLVVGRVESVDKHPDADRLNLTKVNIGNQTLEIVCGAANVAEGQLVAVALIGAKLPNGLKIKKAKVRGVESNGMLCSASELGMEENSDGILELDSDAEIGQRVDEYLQLDDNLIDIDLTPNRGDCLSVQGIARELKVLADGKYHPLDIADVEANDSATIGIHAEDSKACPCYLGRIISGIDVSAKTPLWMQIRLLRSGVRPIKPVVDIGNYVMLELGQPMHAFDLDKLDGDITIRQSKAGEKIKLLDDSEATLDGDTLVIADTQGAIAIAGVMGGADSAISEHTTDIVLEAAHFTRKAIAGRSRRYALHTESSHRFERGVDPQLPNLAMQRATELVLAICGGQAGPVNHQQSSSKVTAKPAVELRFQRLQQLLGMQLDHQEVAGILNRIADSVEQTTDGWSVSPPSYRFDIEHEADLVEEVARVKGYNNIPTAIPRIAPRTIAASEHRVNLRQLRQSLIAREFNEAITYSFIDPDSQSAFSSEPPITLSNPLADNLSVMRTSLLPGLLAALQFNSNRQHERVRLFEIGASYHNSKDADASMVEGFTEVQRLACVIMGPAQANQWGIEKSKNSDFYDLKADLESVLSLTGTKEPFIFNEFEHIALHPGQVAKLTRTGKEGAVVDIGFIGRLHPTLQHQYGLTADVFVFELNLDTALDAELPAFKTVSRFPSIRRDLSVLVQEELDVASLIGAVSDKLGAALKTVVIFDVYHGSGVAKGRKSVSLSLVLQHQDKTMTDNQAEQLAQLALSTLEQEFGAELRS